MKKLLCLSVLMGLNANIGARAETVDRILSIIYHPEETVLILQSDLRPGFDGISKTCKQAVLEKLMEFDAKILKITISDADIDRNLAQIQKQHNLSRKDIIKLFKQMGYTYDEGREKLRIMQMIDNVIDYRVKNKVLVEEKDIIDHYDAYPEYEYELAHCLVPFSTGLKSLQEIALKQAIESGDIITSVTWDEPIKLKSVDLDKDKASLLESAVNKVVLFPETQQGYPLIRLVSKTLVPLEERRKYITQTIGKERFGKALESYHDNLLKDARIKQVASEEDSIAAPVT